MELDKHENSIKINGKHSTQNQKKINDKGISRFDSFDF